jgi:hypothetical protein
MSYVPSFTPPAVARAAYDEAQDQNKKRVHEETKEEDIVVPSTEALSPPSKRTKCGATIVKATEVDSLPWSLKRQVKHHEWGITIMLSKINDKDSGLIPARDYLLQQLKAWTSCTFLYAGPIYITARSAYYMMEIAVCDTTRLLDFEFILQRLGCFSSQRPSDYAVFPHPGNAFMKLVGPVGDTQGRAIIMRGPLYVFGTPRLVSYPWIAEVLCLHTDHDPDIMDLTRDE